MTDLFSERCGDLLTGSYGCVDRILLNAYFSSGAFAGWLPDVVAAFTATAISGWITRT